MAIDLAAVYFSNTIQQYLTATGALILTMLLLWIFKTSIIHRLKRIFEGTENDIDDLIIKIASEFGWPVYIVASLWVTTIFLTIPQVLISALGVITLIVVVFYAARALMDVIDYIIHKAVEKEANDGDDDDVDEGILRILGLFLKIGVWVSAVLLVLQNLGYNITSILAGVGIGGLAIAFALQKIFEDIFASFSIYFDKPFRRGDYIVVGEDSGVVEEIGVKTTRIRTLQGEQLVMSNMELTSARIHNYKKMDNRRVVFSIGLTYDTPNAKLNKVPNIVEKVITKAKLADFNRCHFKSFGDFSLNYEVVYILKSNDYNDYMNTQQEINLGIKGEFEKAKIDMAFPTQTLIMQNDTPPPVKKK